MNGLQGNHCERESDAATIHSESSLSYVISSTVKPLNCFRKPIVLEARLKKNCIIFGEKTRHLINFTDKDTLVEIVKLVVLQNVVNAIQCNLPTLASFQHELVKDLQFWHCKNFVADMFGMDDRREIITTEHNRAHRAAQENVKQVMTEYYFPEMTKMANKMALNCKMYSKAKYERHPQKKKRTRPD